VVHEGKPLPVVLEPRSTKYQIAIPTKIRTITTATTIPMYNGALDLTVSWLITELDAVDAFGSIPYGVTSLLYPKLELG
jgi:secreted protein with Ig-like and vWFA domain